MAYRIPLLILEHAQFLLMSGTMGETGVIEKSLVDCTGRPAAVVETTQRPIQLEYRYTERELSDVLDEVLSAGPATRSRPSHRETLAIAKSAAQKSRVIAGAEPWLKQQISEFRFDTPFGEQLKYLSSQGVARTTAACCPSIVVSWSNEERAWAGS